MRIVFFYLRLFIFLIGFNILELHVYAQSEIPNQNVQTISTDGEKNLIKKMRTIGKKKDKSGIPILIQALKNKDTEIRVAASYQLAFIADKTTVPNLIEALDDDDFRVRVNSTHALGVINDSSALPGLIKALDDKNDKVQEIAISILVNMGKPIVPQLVKTLETERAKITFEGESGRSRVVNSLAIILARLGDKSGVETLFKFFTTTDDEIIRGITRALCLMKDDAVTYDLVKYAATFMKNAREKFLKENPQGIQMQGWQTLQQVSNLMFLPITMIDELVNSNDSVIAVLMKGLEDKDSWVRYFSAVILSERAESYPTYNKTTLIKAFISHLDDPDPLVQSQLVSFLNWRPAPLTKKQVENVGLDWEDVIDKLKKNNWGSENGPTKFTIDVPPEAEKWNVEKSKLFQIKSIQGTIFDPSNKDGIWEEDSSTEVHLKPQAGSNLRKDEVVKISKEDSEKMSAIMQQARIEKIKAKLSEIFRNDFSKVYPLLELSVGGLGNDKIKWQQWFERNKDAFGVDEVTPGVIKADKILDLVNSNVQYEVSTQSGDILLVDVAYNADRPNPEVSNVVLSILQPKADGQYKDFLLTKEGNKLIITYEYLKGVLYKLAVDVDYRPKSNAEGQTDTFMVTSRGGYEIDFTFIWGNEGKLENVKISPKINPFDIALR